MTDPDEPALPFADPEEPVLPFVDPDDPDLPPALVPVPEPGLVPPFEADPPAV
jgi:hypothetical protein